MKLFNLFVPAKKDLTILFCEAVQKLKRTLLHHGRLNILYCRQFRTGDCQKKLPELHQEDFIILQGTKITFLSHFSSKVHQMIVTEFRIHEYVFLDVEFLLVIKNLGACINDQ